jgi:ATP-dependent HslUV protease subunit HslV
MTTIVAVRKGQTAVLAADSQSTFGDTRLAARFDASPNKIFTFGENYFAISGSAAHDLVLQQALQKIKKPDFSSRRAVFESFRQLHPILKEEYFLRPEEDDEDPYESSHMTILLANAYGIFGIYSLREVFEYQQFWAIGSGREFALGAMSVAYASKADAAKVAKAGVEAGALFDINSSLPMTRVSVALSAQEGDK